MTDKLVSTEWLATHLADANLVILDASYHLPDTGRDAYEEYAKGHIPGAIYMDLPRLRNVDNPLPSMLPTASQFRHHIGALGVTETSHVVLYDNAPHITSARAWFIFHHFGLDNVSILDGGLSKWRAEGRVLEIGTFRRSPRQMSAKSERTDVRTLADVKSILETGSELLVDARGAGRFSGAEPETRPGLASGHIPGSVNLPYSRLFNADNTWKRGDALREAFAEAGVDLNRPLVTTCGSGITAAVVLFGAYLLGKEDVALYDGSWTEWGADPTTPKATGAA